MKDAKRKGSIQSAEMKVFPYLMIFPNLFIFAIFIAVPAVFGFAYSLTDWGGLGELNFIGLSNYVKLFHDSYFWTSIRQTFIYAIIALPMIVAIPLLLATLLVKNIRGRSFFRAVFYWPSMISYIVVGLLFQFILVIALVLSTTLLRKWVAPLLTGLQMAQRPWPSLLSHQYGRVPAFIWSPLFLA